MRHCEHILDADQIASFFTLEAVQTAKRAIDARSSGSVHFSVPISDSIKAALLEKLGLDLSHVSSVPMRWMKGDTAPHVDTGAAAFDNTYLMYLTDSDGALVVDGQSYPISQGSGYVFPESLMHETCGTGSEPRLLLGPMSEAGFAVGFGGIFGPGGTSIFIRQSVSGYEYSNDQLSWSFFSFPIFVTNTDTVAGSLKIEFASDMTLTSANDYFVCNSTHIQFGSASLKNDGTRPIITIDGVANYPGFISNGGELDNGRSNIYIYNLEVKTTNGSTLFSSGGRAGGWIGHFYFSRAAPDNFIINCSSDGPIPFYGGGIVGNLAGADTGASLTIIGCSSSGAIGDAAGGIVGNNASNNGGSVVCDSCWSTGSIDNDAGGITGNGTGYAVITNCYSTGAISGLGGGICGSVTARVGRTVTITNCYSTGSIAAAAGGIVGQSAGTVTISNCYSLGNMGNIQSGGIMANTNGTGAVITNCYTVGSVVGGQGYITGLSATVPATCFSEAKTGTPGTWSTTNANTALQGIPSSVVGATWVATTVNEPYELRVMGYTPYTIANIVTVPTPALKRNFTTSLAPGSSTGAAVIENKNYTILQITGGDTGSYSSIQILDSLTGVISTTSETVPGTYTLYVRNLGSYHITEYILTVTGNGGGGGGGDTNEGVLCCQKPLFLGNTVDNTMRSELIAGNVLVASVRRGPISHAEVLARRKANASKR